MSDEIYVPLSARPPIIFTLEEMPRDRPPVTFHLRRPTPMQRQSVRLELNRRGIRQPSRDNVRAAQIDAIVRLRSEEDAAIVEQFRMDEKGYNEICEEWGERERQRRIDEENGADPIAPEPAPPEPWTQRTVSQVNLLLYIANEDPLVCQLLDDDSRYLARSLIVLAKISILPTTEGLPFELVYEKSRFNEGQMELADASIDEIMEYCGDEGFYQVLAHLNQGLSGHEEKNSASPSETGSDLTASPETNDASESSNGNSSTSDSGPPRPSVSEMTTEKSSISASESAPLDPSDTPTDAPE